MKVLLLTQWYLPEPQKVVSDIAESLQEMGHEVTVLTGFPNYPSGKVYPGYRIKLWQKETINGVSVIRVPLYPDHSQSARKRILNYFSFAASVLLLGPWLTPRVDVIHVIPPLTAAWAGWMLARLKRIPFTHEVQDLWPETLSATGMVQNVQILSGVGWFAKRIYHKAAAIRVISPGFRNNLIGKGVPEEKIHFISNWVDEEFYAPELVDPVLAERLGFAGRFNIVYAGTIGPAQGIETVIEAAELLQDLPVVQFVIVGDGISLASLRAIVEAKRLQNVRFLGRFPAEEMSNLYALSDVLLLHLRDDPLFRITIPHKTLVYMATAKPILAAITGDAANIINSAQAGLTCPPSNPQEMADAVRHFYHMLSAEREAMGNNGRAAACGPYSRKCLTTELVKLLEEVVQGRRKKYSAFSATSSRTSSN